MNIETIFLALLLFFGFFYTIIILSYTFGWFTLKPFQCDIYNEVTTKASIIIPARNEEANISFLLHDLCNQSVPNHLYEIIVADDNSTDQTASIVSTFIENQSTPLIIFLPVDHQSVSNTFKKNAIASAIDKATGDLIVTTDADCRLGPQWLGTILQFYQHERPKMIVGPVIFHNANSLFEKAQTTEFLSLIAITGGAIQISQPIMCNGANLAYERSAFEEVGGFGADRFASGDDVFLLLKMVKKFGKKSIRFLKSREAMVHTEAKKSLKEFIQQRTRWASKNKGYGFNILWVSITVYMINLLIISGFVLSVRYHALFPVALTAVLVKLIIDLPILLGIITFAKQSKMFIYSIPLIFFYPIYIVLTGALGIIANYQWKGRRIKN